MVLEKWGLIFFLFLGMNVSADERITFKEFDQALRQSIEKIDQFRYLRSISEKFGVRVYLFGGTAASLAHYVKQDQARLKGNQAYDHRKFDYDFTSIYRSTQDIDIVVDGAPQIAEKIADLITRRYPHVTGDKSDWEIRLLREDYHSKDALLENQDFLNQHTDSHSVGLIEVTNEHQNEPVWKDLRHWNIENPPFVQDVLESKLDYYYSASHDTTSRARMGLNPPIFSVIRVLIKAFQFELAIRPEDLQTIRQIVRDFEPDRDISNFYTRYWLDKNARKLFQNAVNVEYAWDTLEALGLRRKLIQWSGTTRVDSLGWWLSKEPLRSRPVGEGSGRTARELGITEVAHETRSFLAYEAITRSNKSEPNVFISRMNAAGEAADYGNGFYTRIGRLGARETGLTIRFVLDPNAREGTDFSIHNEFVLIRNKQALKVNTDDLSLHPLDYLNLLRERKLTRHDLGTLYKLENRFVTKRNGLSEEDKTRLLNLIKQEMTHLDEDNVGWTLRGLQILTADGYKPRETEDLVDSIFSQFDEYEIDLVVGEMKQIRTQDIFNSLAYSILRYGSFNHYLDFLQVIEELLNGETHYLVSDDLLIALHQRMKERMKMLDKALEGPSRLRIKLNAFGKKMGFRDSKDESFRLMERDEITNGYFFKGAMRVHGRTNMNLAYERSILRLFRTRYGLRKRAFISAYLSGHEKNFQLGVLERIFHWLAMDPALVENEGLFIDLIKDPSRQFIALVAKKPVPYFEFLKNPKVALEYFNFVGPLGRRDFLKLMFSSENHADENGLPPLNILVHDSDFLERLCGAAGMDERKLILQYLYANPHFATLEPLRMALIDSSPEIRDLAGMMLYSKRTFQSKVFEPFVASTAIQDLAERKKVLANLDISHCHLELKQMGRLH